jgi:quinol monooxygenase YgiN
MYFGTVARYRVKQGQDAGFLDQMKSFEDSPPAGWIYTTLFRSASDPNEVWMSVVFEDEASYRANADSPAMDQRFRALSDTLEGDPEWHDGHVIYEAMRKG